MVNVMGRRKWSMWSRIQREVQRLPIQAYRWPSRRRSRGRRAAIEIPRELLTCGCGRCQPDQALFTARIIPLPPTTWIHVWLDGTSRGNCTHCACGQTIHRLRI